MRVVAPGLLVSACLFWNTAARGDAASATACMELASLAVDERSEYLAALQIETRKAGLPWTWMPKGEHSDCPAGRPTVSFRGPGHAALTLPTGGEHTFELAEIQGAVRARSLARFVVAVLTQAEATGSSTVPLPLLPGDDIAFGRPSPTPVSTISARPRNWTLRAGGAYFFQPGNNRHLAGPILEAGLALYQRRLFLSVVGAYGSGTEIDVEAFAVDLEIRELLAMARVGLARDAWLLRMGIGSGWQRRYVVVGLDGMRDALDAFVSDTGVVALDMGLVWSFSRRWNIRFLIGARAYWGGPESLLQRAEYRPAQLAIGSQLAVGVTL